MRAAPLPPTILALTTACHGTGPEITVSTEVVTVASATWGDDGTASRVRVDGPDGAWVATEWQDPNPGGHEALILGLYPDEAWAAFVETASGASLTGVDFRTGPLPTDFPSWRTAGQPGWEGYWITSLLETSSWPVILDEAGRVVWYRKVAGGGRVLRVRLRGDGDGVRFANSQLTDDEDNPTLDAVRFDGTVDEQLNAPYFTHDFVEKTPDVFGMIVKDSRGVAGFDVLVDGNRLIELGTDGAERTVWSTWDHWDPAVGDFVEEDGTWTHGNALDYDAAHDVYTVGFRGVDAIVEVDNASGEALRQVGGPTSSYAELPKADRQLGQHQFQWIDGGILVFDNHTEASGSRVLAMGLDDDSGVATLAWSLAHDPPLYTFAMGDVDLAEDGSLLVTWSSNGVVTDFGPDGDVRWELSTDIGTGFGYVERSVSLPGIARLH